MTEPLFADPFTYVIQHLNSNPYVLSEAQKPSVIDFIKTLRYDYYNVHRSDCAVHNEPAYPNGPCDCGAAYSQFMTDVLTAAGLIEHGKQSKALSQRLADGVMLFRLASCAAPQQAEHSGCACRWDADDNRVATCVRHQGWLDVVSEWANRAKDAEAKLAQQAEPDDLYWRLHTLSKMLEGSDRIDGMEHEDAYPTILDAMLFVRKQAAPQQAEPDMYKKDQKTNTSQERVQKS